MQIKKYSWTFIKKNFSCLSPMNDKCKNVVLLPTIIFLMWVNHRLKRIYFSILYLLSIVRNWILKESIFIIRAWFAFRINSLFQRKFWIKLFNITLISLELEMLHLVYFSGLPYTLYFLRPKSQIPFIDFWFKKAV